MAPRGFAGRAPSEPWALEDSRGERRAPSEPWPLEDSRGERRASRGPSRIREPVFGLSRRRRDAADRGDRSANDLRASRRRAADASVLSYHEVVSRRGIGRGSPSTRRRCAHHWRLDRRSIDNNNPPCDASLRSRPVMGCVSSSDKDAPLRTRAAHCRRARERCVEPKSRGTENARNTRLGRTSRRQIRRLDRRTRGRSPRHHPR